MNDQCPLAPPLEWLEMNWVPSLCLEDRKREAIRQAVRSRANVFFRCGGRVYRVWYDVLLGQVIRQPLEG